MRKYSKRVSLMVAVAAAGASSARADLFDAPADLLVCKANSSDGGGGLLADSVTISEYAPMMGQLGTALNVINLPTDTLSYDGTSGLGLTLPDDDSHEGQLTLSSDGHQLLLGTYLSQLGPIDYYGIDVGPDNAPASQVPRVITVIHPDGTIDDSTQLTGPSDYNTVEMRQVTSLNGTQFWITGNGDKPYDGAGVQDIGGLRYATLGASSTTSLNVGNGIDIRSTTIFEGQLYGDGGSNNSPPGEHTLSQLGQGIPTTPPNWAPLPSTVGAYADGAILGNQSPNFLTLNDGHIVLYQSDSTTGDLEKYTLENGLWVLDGRLTFGKDFIEDVAARVVGNNVVVYITNLSDLYQVTDTGGAGQMKLQGLSSIPSGGSYSLYGTLPKPLLTDASNELRGISFAPSSSAAVGNQIWASSTGGSWTSANNWADGLPNASGATATFGVNSPGLISGGVVTLDGAQTVGHVVFNNAAANYTISPGNHGTLTIDNTDPNASGVPSIYDENGNDVISAPINLVGGVTLSAAYNSSLTVSGPVSGSGGINVYGLGYAGPGVTQAQLGVVTLTVPNSYAGTTTVGSGSLVIAAAGALPAGSTVVNNGALLIQANTITGNISGTGSLVVGTSSTPEKLQILPGSGMNTLGALTINSGSTLDITNNILAVNYGTAPDPSATIRGYLKSAYNGGVWTGTGLTSSTVAAQVAATIAAHTGGVYGIGYVDGGVDLNQSNGAVVTAMGKQIVYTPALVGDANLDGGVTFIDLGIVAQNLGATNSDWEHGDFNYDGSVNFLDVGLLAQNLNKTTLNTPLAELVPDPSAALVAQWNLAVAEIQSNQTEPTNLPEPGMIGWLILGASGLLSRRRQRADVRHQLIAIHAATPFRRAPRPASVWPGRIPRA